MSRIRDTPRFKRAIKEFSRDARYPHYERLKFTVSKYVGDEDPANIGFEEMYAKLEAAYAEACFEDNRCSAEQIGKP